MESIQHKRKESILFHAIAQIVSEEITNANISYPTVTRVKLSRDSSHINVFVTFENSSDRSLIALQSSAKFVRKRISRLPNLRKVPEVHFMIDHAIEEGQRIDKILEEIKKESK